MWKLSASYCLLLFMCLVTQAQTFEYRTYYDKEKTHLKEIISLREKDSVLHGPYSSFMQNGAPKASGYYDKGNPVGQWTYYFESNHIRAQGNLQNGKQNGPWEYYYETGTLKALGHMIDGIREGEWINYYENGDEKSRGIYLDNKKDGKWEYYFEGGGLKAETYFDEGIGHYKEYYPAGQLKMEGQNRNDRSEGLWKYYYESGELESEGNFKNGQRVGRWAQYHKNGNLASEGFYEAGKKSGEWTYYYETGSISSHGTLVDDVREGQWSLYFENGNVSSLSEYDHGSGPSTEYYPGGQILAEGNIKDGKKTGEWIYYDKTGLKNGEAIFENGIGDFTGYYEDGTIKMKGKLDNARQVGEWTLYDVNGEISGKYRPLYEEDPITSSSPAVINRTRSSRKPAYKFKSKKNRYFDSVVNEFRGLSVTANPIWIATGNFPVAAEIYKQERLGHELIYTYYRDPFIVADGIQQLGQVYRRGHEINFRQKLYSKDQPYGMPYFGHGIGFSISDYNVDVEDATVNFQRTTLTSRETIAFYGLFAGLKWMRSPSQSGFTVDLFIGMDIGVRNWRRLYNSDVAGDFDLLYADENQDALYLPFNFGINFGWMIPLKRKKR